MKKNSPRHGGSDTSHWTMVYRGLFCVRCVNFVANNRIKVLSGNLPNLAGTTNRNTYLIAVNKEALNI